MTAQGRPGLALWIDGVAVEQPNRFVLELEVEERTEGASSLRMVLDMSPVNTADGRGDWDMLQRGGGRVLDSRGGPFLELMSRVTVGFSRRTDEPGDSERLAVIFDGFVIEMEPFFGENRVGDSQLEVGGLDASALMHFETVTRVWSGISDAEIARTIYRKYGFTVDDESVEETTPVRALERGAMIQRCTDAEFLRMLARRHGFEAYVEPVGDEIEEGAQPRAGIVGHFHRPRPDAEPAQPGLALFPEDAPTLIEFSARWTAFGQTRTRGWRLDERSRLVEAADVVEPGWPRQGERSRADTIRARMAALSHDLDAAVGEGSGAGGGGTTAAAAGEDGEAEAAVLEAAELNTGPVPHDAGELSAMATSVFREADWFVHGKGVVMADRYPEIIRARRPVPVSGAGRILEGLWYCRAARHRWARSPDVPRGEDSAQVSRRYEVDVTLVRSGLTSSEAADGGAEASP